MAFTAESHSSKNARLSAEIQGFLLIFAPMNKNGIPICIRVRKPRFRPRSCETVSPAGFNPEVQRNENSIAQNRNREETIPRGISSRAIYAAGN